MIPTQYTIASLKCALHSDMFKQDGWHILTSVCGRNALITAENSHLASCRQKAIRHGITQFHPPEALLQFFRRFVRRFFRLFVRQFFRQFSRQFVRQFSRQLLKWKIST